MNSNVYSFIICPTGTLWPHGNLARVSLWMQSQGIGSGENCMCTVIYDKKNQAFLTKLYNIIVKINYYILIHVHPNYNTSCYW